MDLIYIMQTGFLRMLNTLKPVENLYPKKERLDMQAV